MNAAAEACGSPHAALHLATRVEDWVWPPTTEEVVERLVAVTQLFADRLDAPLLVANVPYGPLETLLSEPSEPRVIRAVSERAGSTCSCISRTPASRRTRVGSRCGSTSAPSRSTACARSTSAHRCRTSGAGWTTAIWRGHRGRCVARLDTPPDASPHRHPRVRRNRAALPVAQRPRRARAAATPHRRSHPRAGRREVGPHRYDAGPGYRLGGVRRCGSRSRSKASGRSDGSHRPRDALRASHTNCE